MGAARKLAIAALTLVALLAVGTAGATAAVKKNGIYKGTTQSGGKVSLLTSSKGTYFGRSDIAFSAACNDGTKFSDFLPLDGIAIGTGAFSDKIDTTDKGVRVELTVEGAFSPDLKAVTGTYQVKVSSGTDSCDTGSQTFSADFKGTKKKKKKKHKHH